GFPGFFWNRRRREVSMIGSRIAPEGAVDHTAPKRFRLSQIEENHMSRPALSRAFVAVGIVLAYARATWAAAPPRKVASGEGITEYRLENGLQVLLFPDPSRPKVTVNMTVFAGSRHEGYGETGKAHLLEHMVFKGTPTHPDIPKVLKEHGAQFNGTTWFDRTNYFETLNATDENLECPLKPERDRRVNRLPRGSALA